jgi:hypothetical protein
MATCRHLLSEIVEGSTPISTPEDIVPACSLAFVRSRGCTPGTFAKELAPAVFDEVKTLLSQIDPDNRTEEAKVAATRLAQIVRREAMEERNLLALVRAEDTDVAASLMPLLARR